MSNKQDMLNEWLKKAENYDLPDWSTLPSIPLYMDQILMFTGEALALFERDEKQSLLTSSMINNYVKSGLVEHPVHKKYAKEHLSKVIMTGMLKQVLSIQDISVLFSGESDPQTLYTAFTEAQDRALHETAGALDPNVTEDELRAAALRMAAEANARRAVAERILLTLSDVTSEENKTKEKNKEPKTKEKKTK